MAPDNVRYGAVYRPAQQITSDDTGSIDAFSRWRVSSPAAVFDAQLTYDLHPLLLEQTVTGTGAALAHDATNRRALFTFSGTDNGTVELRSFEHFRYQPGKSQSVFLTFNFVETSASVTKVVGYSDGTNGIELQQVGSTVQFALLSATDHGTETVTQAHWNLDTLDGTGASGVTLDLTKTQILAIDFQALYVGRVRVGFDIGGVVVPVHEFNHANVDANPYIQTANLPIRWAMTSAAAASTTMHAICCSVVSEGGVDDVMGYGFAVEGTGTAGNGSDVAILHVQPATTFNSIVNRSKFVLESVDIVVTGNQPVAWKLCIGQALTSPSVANVNATYSAMQTVTGTLDGTPAIVMARGYVASTASVKQALSRAIANRYPITLNAAGAVRDLGRLTFLAAGIGGTSATRCTFNWREIR